MSLGMSIFLEWFGAIVVGTLLGLVAGYIFDKNDADEDKEDKDEK